METVRALPFVLTISLAATAFAPPPSAGRRRHLPPLALPAKEWRPAREKPEAVAARADARLAGMKNAIVSSLATIDLTNGTGEARMRSIIRSSDRFEIQTVRLGTKKYEEVRKAIWRLESGRLAVFIASGWMPKPVSSFRTLPGPLPISFKMSFDEILMRGVRGARPMTRLVASARRSGWSVAAESNPRLVPPTTRLRFTAPGGKLRYGVDVDADRSLVSQIEVDDSRGAKPFRVLWSAAWGIKNSPLTAADIASFDPARPGG